MKLILKSLILLSLSLSAQAFELRPGDVLLIELRCYSCSIIADETGSRFSHSGVVLAKQGEQYLVAQALGQVHATTLEKFKSQKTKLSSMLVLRPKSFSPSEKLLNVFNRDWSGIPFDSNYTWDDEKLYCSEFVAKFLERFMGQSFLQNLWIFLGIGITGLQ
ncbi:MAG: YiiX/YebB-like N1pC/P60 family cysteine hydrolase [bacterium]